MENEKTKITTIVPMMGGLLDYDHPPIVKRGHLTQEEATAFARSYGDCYPYCSGAEHDEVECCQNWYYAAWYVCFSNEENPPIVDGVVDPEHKAELELLFFLGEVS